MNLKRPLSLLACGLAASGVLVGLGTAAAQAYCPTDPDGTPYGYSDPRAGEYGGTEVYCPPARDGSISLPGTDSAPSGWVDVDWTSTPASGPIDWRVFDITPNPFGVGFAEHDTIYESADELLKPPYFNFGLPGQTSAELIRTDKGADYSGLPKGAAKPAKVRLYTNPNAGRRLPDNRRPSVYLEYVNPRTGLVSIHSASTMSDLAQFANLTYFTDKDDADEATYVKGVVIAFTSVDIPRDNRSLTDLIFTVSNGSIASCTGGSGLFTCEFQYPSHARTDTPVPPSASPILADSLSQQSIPICSGGIVDAGYGSTSRFTLAQANCDAAPDKEPVSLRIDQVYTSTESGIPFTDAGDGSIAYSPTQEAAGRYVPMRVWATSADGTESWPFYVIFRVRNAPTVTDEAPTIDTLRGVEARVEGDRLFGDVDVDVYQTESHDTLAPEIVGTPGRGTAWFDAAGDLHYQPVNLTEAYTDHVTVRAVDSFGYASPELVVPITVGDVRPGCDTGAGETDNTTPLTISLHCWLIGPEGWTQRPDTGLEYSLTGAPTSGTVTGLDTVSGRATFTPDRGAEGPVTFQFKAEYNGEVREASYTVMVHAAP